MAIVAKGSVSYNAVMLFWRTITQIFFREIRPRGAFNIPRDGPVIFVGAPHNNQFLDPLLLTLEVYRETHRRVQFLTAAKSMERKAIGFFARLMDSIPVVRAADSASPGTGRIWLSPDDPCLVLGEGTAFLSEFAPRMQIMLPKSLGSLLAEVSEVISDTELRIKREFGGDSGKGTAKVRERISELRREGTMGLEFKKLPFVDQQEMYRHVYKCLNEGGAIGIFPEGGSHDRTDLLPFKAGVSVMALGAMANDPNLRVKIVPVGLSYFHAHKFRSRAVVEFGGALDVPAEYVEMFKEGGAQKREAVAKFLNLIYDALKTVTIRAPDYDTLMLIQAVRRLYKTPGQHLTLGQVVELNKRLLEGYHHFKDEPRVQKLREGVLKYNRLVRDLGLRDHQVPRAQKASWKTLGLLTYRVGLLMIWTILALPGTILNGPMFILASLISRKKAKEALAASVVKIAGRDVLATWKILICLGVAPVLYTFYAFLATLVAIRAKAPLKWRIATPFLVFVALPFMNYAALKFGEAGVDVMKSLRPLIVALVPGQQKSLENLKKTRVELSNEVADLINDFGPKLYDDFNEWRILVPSASVPPSTGTPGIWRRKSGTGAVDAQGLGLTHPMTWIDERLFGWSRSAKRGTSAWGGFSGDESSRIGTPDESDDEDSGDYDNVVGVIPPTDEPATTQKPKSRQSSFADLQRLRLSPYARIAESKGATDTATVSPTSTEEGLHLRQGHRTRRETLSDGVPVTRIAAVDRAEPFATATHDLNDEINRNRTVKDHAE
ncbi:putative glycerol-3-phosphate O-acyltransferase [Lyophyllum shimeji]|uniref:Glycerol-3-phosphate O-acyltransferase n=1 Tax=Lyophyllum shimeji TaxID=47721 RepID=A0A9P3PFE7_LYOSH|nr:putative glycerol-3-phosphate O-acyltransferase [Lyophyllum shimeji]